MCGRYTLVRLADFTDMFPWIRPSEQPPPPRYNIAPTQAIAVVPNTPDPHIDFFHWGFIPYWAKDPSIGNRMINARAETLAQKPVFRNALKRRRCLIPTDGFYEWKKNPDGSKTPMYVRMKSAKPFALAGLWERWNSPDGSELRSCTIITGQPNELVREIHDRMPVIIPAELYRRWLDPAELPAEQVQELLHVYPAEEMQATPVSRRVNNPKVDSRECIEAVTAEDAPAPDQAAPSVRQARTTRRKSAKPESDQGRLF